MPDRILVTGGAGFIGSHVTKELTERGHDVVVLDDLSGGFVENVDPRAEFVRGSITDRALVGSLFERHGFRYVYHLAAYAAEGLSHFIKRFNYENNLIGSINLINAAVNHEVECFVFTSSIAVYGTNQLPMTEELTPVPEDPYGIAKLAVEQELAATRELFGMEYIVFRPHNVYGENQNIGDAYRNVIGIFMNCLMRGEPMPIFGDGEQTRAFTYIGDVAPVIAASVDVAAARNGVFNIGADQPCTVNELSEAVARALDAPPERVHRAGRKEVRHAYCEHEKAQRVFGHSANVTLEDGIARMARWARRVGPRASEPFSTIEIRKNLPEGWAQAVASAGPGRSKWSS